MAQLKSTVVQGSLRATDSIYTNELQTRIIQAPTTSNGTTYGVGTNGQVLKSNGTHVYWAAESGSVTGVKGNSESSYRTGQVNITAANIGLGNVENTTLSTWTGTGTIAKVGTITTGTWNGTAVALKYGGTGTDNTAIAINKVFAGPASGSAGNASFRSLVAADISSITTTADTSNELYMLGVTSSATTTIKYNSGVKAKNGAVTASTYNGLTLTAASTGFTIAGGTTSKTLTVNNTYTLGAACAYGVDDATANGALGTGTGLTTERSVYYGLVTVNNASQTRATGIYAPTSAGTANQILVSAGGTSAPTWKATASGAAYATSANGALTFGTLPVAQGGTGLTSSPSMLINLASTAADNILSASPRPGITGTLEIGNGGTGKTTAAEAWTNLGGGASGKHAENYYALASHNHAGYVEAKSYAITIPASVTSYAFTDSSSWITADCACIATDLQAKDPKAIITWSFTNDHKINFTLSAAGTISFNMWVAKIIT